MLKTLNTDQVHFLALLAQTARAQRDRFLGNVPERDLAETQPGRGEHNPTAMLGFEPAPAEGPPVTNLSEAVAALSPDARSELYVLMRIGQGDLAPAKWHRGIVEASTLGDEAVTAAILGDSDLHDHLAKGLYEARLLP